MASESVTLPAEAIPDLRKMLIVGLAALAEIERVKDFIDLERSSGGEVPDLFVPKHPTGAYEMGDFAMAFLWLEQAQPVEA